MQVEIMDKSIPKEKRPDMIPEEFKDAFSKIFKPLAHVKLNFDPNHPFNQKYDEVTDLEKDIRFYSSLLESIGRHSNISHADERESRWASREREIAQAKLDVAKPEFEVLQQVEKDKPNGLLIERVKFSTKNLIGDRSFEHVMLKYGIRVEKTAEYLVMGGNVELPGINPRTGMEIPRSGRKNSKKDSYYFEYVLIGLKEDMDRCRKEVLKKLKCE
jgi:hypothetical protein